VANKVFKVGDVIRYKPGNGTYGYEDAVEADGRIPGIVIEITSTRIRVRLTLAKRGGMTIIRGVNANSLIISQGAIS
jgi:hypothetical protein